MNGNDGTKGDKGDLGNKGGDGTDGVKGDPGIPGKPGFSAAVYSFSGKLAGTPTAWVAPGPPPTTGGTSLTISEFLNLEGLTALAPVGNPTWPSFPALPNTGTVIPGNGSTSNNNFFGRVLPAGGYVTHFAVNFIATPSREGRIRIAIANATNPPQPPASQLINEEILMDPNSSPYGSVTIPVVLNTNSRFTKGSYIFALSFGEDGARLPPLGLTSVSVYVNFE